MHNVVGPPVTGENLFGREYELDTLWTKLGRGEHILMLAPRRVGKSSLMMELCRNPQPNWHAIYVDLQAGDSAEDCFAAILAALANRPEYRTWLEAIPFRKSVGDLLGGLTVSAKIEVLRVDFKAAMSGDWQHTADQLQNRLANLPNPDEKLLLVLDELPMLVSRIIKKGDGVAETDLLLSKLREMRLSESWSDRIQTLVGGSIGLEGILRRIGLSATVNDLSPFPVNSWDQDTAGKFLKGLGVDEGFPLTNEHIARMLELLGDPNPYLVQLFFGAAKDACKGQIGRLSIESIDRCFHDRLTGPSGTPHLDHYAERLETILTAPELEMARAILAKACRSKDGVTRADLSEEEDRDEAIFMFALRQIESDGYIVWDGNSARFPSNLLRQWWKRYQAPKER